MAKYFVVYKAAHNHNFLDISPVHKYSCILELKEEELSIESIKEIIRKSDITPKMPRESFNSVRSIVLINKL